MSTKKASWFSKSKKVSLKEAPKPPRTMEEINKEYSEALSKAGQSQYLLYVYGKELEQSNSRLLALNQEASARQTLDQAAKAAETKPEAAAEVKNEQA